MATSLGFIGSQFIAGLSYQWNIDLGNAGILIVVTVVIGQVTPPVALSLVVAAKIAKVDVMAALRANTPFLIATVALLLVLAALPGLALWLPRVLD